MLGAGFAFDAPKKKNGIACAHHIITPEIVNGFLEALFQLNRRLPTERLPGEGNVGPALLRVVLRSPSSSTL